MNPPAALNIDFELPIVNAVNAEIALFELAEPDFIQPLPRGEATSCAYFCEAVHFIDY
jgi:hypothetical protein